MEIVPRGIGREGNNLHGLKVSDLLPHLSQKGEWPGGPKHHLFLGLRQHCSRLRSLSRDVGDESVCRTQDSALTPVPAGVQGLSEWRCQKHRHPPTPGPQTKGFRGILSRDEKQSGQISPQLPTASYFLPYIAAGRPGVPSTHSPDAIHQLFQEGVLCSEMFCFPARTDRDASPLWVTLEEPPSNSSTSERYFEDLEDLQRKLYTGVLTRSTVRAKPRCRLNLPSKTIRKVRLSDSSMACVPPLVSRKNVYFNSSAQ